jgi:hypothetical protein
MSAVKDAHKVEIYTLEGLQEFASFLKTPEEIPNLNQIHTLDLEGLSSLLFEQEKKQAVRLISYILKHDPFIEELLFMNNSMSKSILADLSKVR